MRNVFVTDEEDYEEDPDFYDPLSPQKSNRYAESELNRNVPVNLGIKHTKTKLSNQPNSGSPHEASI